MRDDGIFDGDNIILIILLLLLLNDDCQVRKHSENCVFSLV